MIAHVAASIKRRQARLLRAIALSLAALVAGTMSGSGRAAPVAPYTVKLYSVAVEEQYVNNADDRRRGEGSNPFGNFKDATATTKQAASAPRPGDEAVFKFRIYLDMALSKRAGTATFTCQYGFNSNAFCDALYDLTGGTIVGAGPVSFNAPDFAIAITDGTGKYRSATGEIDSLSRGTHAQALRFLFN